MYYFIRDREPFTKSSILKDHFKFNDLWYVETPTDIESVFNVKISQETYVKYKKLCCIT